jgi:hypothetical protein
MGARRGKQLDEVALFDHGAALDGDGVVGGLQVAQPAAPRRCPHRTAVRRSLPAFPATTIRPEALVSVARLYRPAALAAGESAAERRLHLNGTPYPSNSPARQAPPLDPAPAQALDIMDVAAAQFVGALTQRAAGERRAGSFLEPTTRIEVRAGRPDATSPATGRCGSRGRRYRTSNVSTCPHAGGRWPRGRRADPLTPRHTSTVRTVRWRPAAMARLAARAARFDPTRMATTPRPKGHGT